MNRGPAKKRRRQTSDSEKKLEELVFGKNILAETPDTNKKHKKKVVHKTPPPAWEDEDDDLLEVNLDDTDRLKKLKTQTKKGKSVISGTEFSTLLKERFQSRTFAWANTKLKSGADSLLQEDGSMLGGGRPALLPAGRLDIRRLVDANIVEPSNKDIRSVRFHANGSLLLAAGEDKSLRFFRIDGETNEKQLSVRFNDMSIKTAEFLNGPQGRSSGEVVLGGRKPYFYCYDTASGSVIKIQGCPHKEIKSHETLAVSPSLLSSPNSSPTSHSHSSGYIAVAGASGYVHLMNGKMKTWVGDLKLSSGAGVRAINFLSDHVFTASGLNAEVYLWDLRMLASGGGGGLLHKFTHDDGTVTSSLASGGSAARRWMAVGAESGAVSLYNNFSTDPPSSLAAVEESLRFQKQRTVLNLTHKITTMAFHPSAEMMAIATDQAKDQLKLVHLPSCTVFSNWPTERTPLGRVKCLDFSPGGAFLAQGDHRGRVMLYRLNHFQNA